MCVRIRPILFSLPIYYVAVATRERIFRCSAYTFIYSYTLPNGIWMYRQTEIKWVAKWASLNAQADLRKGKRAYRLANLISGLKNTMRRTFNKRALTPTFLFHFLTFGCVLFILIKKKHTTVFTPKFNRDFYTVLFKCSTKQILLNTNFRLKCFLPEKNRDDVCARSLTFYIN